MMLELDRSNSMPLYLQLCHQLRDQILSGRLPPGTRLPSERRLSVQIGVNRTTVVSAYRELAADGLVEAHVGRGTTVVEPPSDSVGGTKHWSSSASRDGVAATPAGPPRWTDLFVTRNHPTYDATMRDLLAANARADTISFAAGGPGEDLYPLEEFAELTAGLLRREGGAMLRYGAAEGHPLLRAELAARIAERGCRATADDLIVLSGSQQGLYLLARILLREGDAVVVENPSFLGALQVFSAIGARLVPVQVDAGGMRLDQLEAVLSRVRPKLIYTMSTFHNPCGMNLAAERRRGLLELADRFDVPVIEDDLYGEIYFETPPPPPLKAFDRSERVVYLSSFSKTVFPGLRVGWICAPRPVLQRLAIEKRRADYFTGSLGQWVFAEYLRNGGYDRHLARIRAAYRERRDAMVKALREIGPALSFTVPPGGFYIWAHLPAGLWAADLLRGSLRRQVAFVPGEAFCTDGGGHGAFRLAFATCAPDRIRAGVARLGEALDELLERLPGGTEPPAALHPIV